MNHPTFDSKDFLQNLSQRPGVYQMYAKDGSILYVGKAKNLKKRLSHYFRSTGFGSKTQALVNKIADIQVTITKSEVDALLLEQNLIKQHRPNYNILLRDDKSYPYIFISNKDTYPAISFHRGIKRKKGDYFGPYPNGSAVRESLVLLQKVFRLRPCEDSVFKNRTRACLEHQIDRCSAPCVNLISPEDYAEDINRAKLFLKGKNTQLMKDLAIDMEQAASQLKFENAAKFRDQISSLQKVQQQQNIITEGVDADVFACVIKAGQTLIQGLFIRAGRIIGSKHWQPKLLLAESPEELLSTFLAQWYLTGKQEIPAEIITAINLQDDCLKEALSLQQGRKIRIEHEVRSQRKQWQQMAKTNAEQQLNVHLLNKQSINQRWKSLEITLKIELSDMECFDISHSSGEATVASCVVFDKNGPRKSDYRRFNIKDITAADDYAAMDQALRRRYQSKEKYPSLLIVDGGKGQLSTAKKLLSELELTEKIPLLGIAKGSTRKAGFEQLLLADGTELSLASDHPALHLLQHIRDESHRFAISGHRAQRAKTRTQSVLQQIPGIGAQRRQALLKHFGAVKEIERASIEEIAKVSSISQTLAETIYANLHSE